jgi:hypothetical protein
MSSNYNNVTTTLLDFLLSLFYAAQKDSIIRYAGLCAFAIVNTINTTHFALHILHIYIYLFMK